MELVDELCDLLQVHANRDKVVCLACYLLKTWGAWRGSAALLAASGRLATARAAARLLDDPAALRSILSYGLGRQEGPLWGAVGVGGGLAQLAYLQLEKLLLLLDTGLWPASEKVDFAVKTGHKVAWTLLAFFALLRAIRALHLSARALQQPSRSKCAGARYTQAALSCSKLALDVLHAASWLPRGWLWGQRISAPRAASVASASALLALLMHYHGKKLAAS